MIALGIATGVLAVLVADRRATLSQQLALLLVGGLFVVELIRLIVGLE